MRHNQHSQQRLLALCEKTAVEKRVTFAKAVKLVMDDPKNFDLMTQAAGLRWKGEKIKSPTVRYWIDPVRKGYLKAYPNIEQYQKDQIVAFLPVSDRDRKEAMKKQARELLQLGYTITATAKALGTSRAKVASWSLERVIPWHADALSLHYHNVSGREIARRLALTQRQVAYFLKGKPRGPLYNKQ